MNIRSTKSPARSKSRRSLLSRFGFVSCFGIRISSLILLSSSVLADTLEPTSGAPSTGFFLSYDNGKFNFMNAETKTLHVSPSGVRRVVLDQPLKATLESKAKRGEKAEILVTGFEAGSFAIERGGKAEKVSLQTISELRVDEVASKRTTDQLETGNVVSKGEEVDLAKIVEPGQVTIVHFHLPKTITSERTGNYVATLERQSKGKLVVKRVLVPDASAPVAKQHQLTTFPQFWLYDKTGKLSSKLTDRFTESDLDAAVKKASR